MSSAQKLKLIESSPEERRLAGIRKELKGRIQDLRYSESMLRCFDREGRRHEGGNTESSYRIPENPNPNEVRSSLRSQSKSAREIITQLLFELKAPTGLHQDRPEHETPSKWAKEIADYYGFGGKEDKKPERSVPHAV